MGGVTSRTQAFFSPSFAFFPESPFRNYSPICLAQGVGEEPTKLCAEIGDSYWAYPSGFLKVEREVDNAFASVNLTEVAGWELGSSNWLEIHQN